MNFLKNKKTFIMASVSITWAVYGWLNGLIDPAFAQATIFGSLQIIFLRNGVNGVK